MLETSKDLLNLSLAIGFGLIAIFLSIALFYAIFVLRDISEVTHSLRKTSRKINDLLIQPAKILTTILSRSRDLTKIVEKFFNSKKRK